jgi:hypothetical protein
VLPTATLESLEARMDLVVHAPGRTIPMLLDVTVVSALSQQSLPSGSARRDGAGAAAAARRKRARYLQANMMPFVIEEHGRLGDDAVAIARQLAPQEPGERTEVLNYLYQTLASIVQRYSADSLLAATQARSSA